MDDGIDLTEEQMAANAEAARAAAPKKRAKPKATTVTVRNSTMMRDALKAAKPKIEKALKKAVADAVKAPKPKASKPDPVETAPKPPKGKPKPATAAPVPKPEPVEAKVSVGSVIEAMVRRDQGATLPQIVAATGWQPHSIRAYITATLGKKRGLPVQRTKAEGQDSVYRIVEVEEAV